MQIVRHGASKWEQEGRTIRASLHLEPDSQSASRARRFVRTALGDSETAETLDVLTLLTSEVVTNAILYGRSEIDVVLERRETGIRVEVADASSRLPARRPLDADMTGGRGLRLLDSLAGGWGVIELASGKVVWFEIETYPEDPDTRLNGRVPSRSYL